MELGVLLRFCSLQELPSWHAGVLVLSRSAMSFARANQGPSRQCNIWAIEETVYLLGSQAVSSELPMIIFPNACLEVLGTIKLRR